MDIAVGIDASKVLKDLAEIESLTKDLGQPPQALLDILHGGHIIGPKGCFTFDSGTGEGVLTLELSECLTDFLTAQRAGERHLEV